MPATSTRHSGWQFRQAGGHQGNDDISAVYEGTEVTRMTESLYKFLKPVVIGTEASVNVTSGLTVNMGTNDDLAFVLRGSDVATSIVDSTVSGLVAETEDFYTISKRHVTAGGVQTQAIMDSGAQGTVMIEYIVGGTATTAKTTSGRALKETIFYQHNGSNARENITAQGNVFSIRAVTDTSSAIETLFMVGEDGEIHAKSSTVDAFDSYDDADLVRAFDVVRAPESVIKSEWDEYVRYNEEAVIATGVLGAPISEGGMINITRLQQLHNGAIWQLWTDVLDVAKALPAAAQEKLPTRIKDRFLALSEG
jgi:hypothetical protein